MFEKEAEEYTLNKLVGLEDFDNYQSAYDRYENGVQDAFKDGAEFGYNKAKEDADKMKSQFLELCNLKDMRIAQLEKANEWHYVKDGDLPKDDKQYLVLFFYNYKGKKEMSFGVRDNLHSDFEIHRCYTEQIIAWKEIVLPELKENE